LAAAEPLVRWAATVLEAIVLLARRAALCGALIASAPSAAVADPLSCATWIDMSSGDRVVALRAGTEASVEAVRPIFAGMHNEKEILDSVRACMQACEPAFLAAFNDLCASNPDADRDAFLARMEPISQHCAEEAIKLTE
jgi:hypothetical protein